MRTVDIGRVKKSDSEFERAMNRKNGFFIVASRIKIGHPHATKADGRYNRSAASKFSLFHICPIQIRGATSSQRWRIDINSASLNGPALSRRAFASQRS